MNHEIQKEVTPIVSDIKTLIEQSRQHIAVSVNAAMTTLYWQIGKRIHNEVLQDQRAEYGKRIVTTLSRQLTQEYDRGWDEKHLRQCMQFAKAFPDEQIVYTLCRQLNWSHLRLIMYIDNPLKRTFYIEVCQLEKWSVRTFKQK